MSIEKSNKIINSWAMYDWANSAFATTVMAVFFPLFYKTYWSEGTDPTVSTARLGTTISFGSALLAFVSPFLGALADRRNSKKLMLIIFMVLGLVGCLWLSTIDRGMWIMASLAYSVALLGFNAGNVFYDSLLPSVATNDKADHTSSLGFGLGYLGGGILLLVNVMMYKNPHWFGLIDKESAVKWSFASVAIWWGVFSIPIIKNVPEPKSGHVGGPLLVEVKNSVRELWKTTTTIYFKNRNLFLYMLAFWLYIDGVYTVITMAVDFGIAIGLKPSDLITAILLVQFIGFPCAIVFSKFAGRWGCRRPILVCIAIYGIGVVFATHMQTATEFYALSVMIGMVQGGVQALSRSLFSKMIPADASGEYFGLFNLVGKFASIFGPLVVSWTAYFTGDNRKGMLGLLALFLIGGYLLSRVKEPAR